MTTTRRPRKPRALAAIDPNSQFELVRTKLARATKTELRDLTLQHYAIIEALMTELESIKRKLQANANSSAPNQNGPESAA